MVSLATETMQTKMVEYMRRVLNLFALSHALDMFALSMLSIVPLYTLFVFSFLQPHHGLPHGSLAEFRLCEEGTAGGRPLPRQNARPPVHPGRWQLRRGNARTSDVA
jgi:hypothetical protein